MRRNFFAVGVLFGLFSLSQLGLANVKVGVFDMQKAIQESKKGKAARAQLQKEFEEKKKKVDVEEASLKKEQEDLQKKAAVMAEKARAEMIMKFQEKAQAHQMFRAKSEDDLRGREAELTKPIVDGLKTKINEVARDRKLDLVLEQNAGLFYALDRTDITEELIRRYDEANP